MLFNILLWITQTTRRKQKERRKENYTVSKGSRAFVVKRFTNCNVVREIVKQIVRFGCKHYSYFLNCKENHKNDRFTITTWDRVRGGYLKTALNNMGCNV